jgi:peptidoglycan hydrolase CwlO-like protein
MPNATATKRPRKSPAERAQADYDAATKSLTTAQAKLAKLQEGVAPAQAEVDRLQARVTYLGQNPDLPGSVTEGAPADA